MGGPVWAKPFIFIVIQELILEYCQTLLSVCSTVQFHAAIQHCLSNNCNNDRKNYAIIVQ